jgi:hypothetical protein
VKVVLAHFSVVKKKRESQLAAVSESFEQVAQLSYQLAKAQMFDLAEIRQHVWRPLFFRVDTGRKIVCAGKS